MGAMEPPVFNTFGLPHHVVFSWLVMVILIGVGVAAARRPAMIPTGLQNLMEAVLDLILNLVDDVMGPEGRRFVPLIGTLGLYIFLSNLLGLVPGFTAPTDNVNTTASCALVVFFTYHWVGVRKHGLWNYLKHFAGPAPWWLVPLMVPIEIISHLARPVSLSLRLLGNMVADHKVVFIFFGIFPLLLPVPFLFLGLLVCFIQAFVFCVLSMIYIAMATEHDH
jgi:F-type H+-transporting ATPase subunit a